MKILNIQIDNFGKFSNYSFDFDEKLNIIDEPNGFGKTTIAQFIKSMIYGMPNKNIAQGTNNRRFKYSPWNSSKYGGKLTFRHLDNTYTIKREFGESKTGDKFSLYDHQRKIEIDKFLGVEVNGNNFGDVLLGVSESSFEKTNFIEQSEVLYFDSKQELHSDINSSLRVLFGDTREDNNYEKALNNLTNAIRELGPQRNSSKYNKNEEEINNLNSLVNESIYAQDKIKEDEAQLLVYNEEKNEIKRQRKEINEKLEQINKKNKLNYQLENYNRLTLNKTKLEEKQTNSLKTFNNIDPKNINLNHLKTVKDEYKEKEKTFIEFKKQKEEEIGKLEEKTRDFDTANTRKIIIEHEQKDLERNRIKTKENIEGLSKQLKPITFITIILSIITLSIYYFIFKNKNNKIKTNINLLEKELKSLNEKYQSNINELEHINKGSDKSTYMSQIKALKEEISEQEDIFKTFKEQTLKIYNDFSVDTNNLELAYHQIETNYNNYIETTKDLTSIHSELSNYNKNQIESELKTFSNLDELELKRKQQELENSNNDLIRKINTLEGQIKNNIDLANNLDLYSTELDDLRLLRQSYEQKRSLLEKSKSFLEEANQRLAARYLEPLQEKVNQLIYKFELKDYKVQFDGNSKMKVKAAQLNNYKNFGYYSTGYQDLMSIIVRIALIEIIYKDIKPFIIFDDSFVNFDDNRIKLVKPLLDKLKEEHQIIYFTCSTSRNLS